jgi:hypothetical protein
LWEEAGETEGLGWSGLGRRRYKGRSSRRNTLEPSLPEALCEMAHIGEQSGGETESAAELGDSINPGFWISADA